MKKNTLISLKTVSYSVPTLLPIDNDDIITNPYDTASPSIIT